MFWVRCKAVASLMFLGKMNQIKIKKNYKPGWCLSFPQLHSGPLCRAQECINTKLFMPFIVLKIR